MVSVSELRKQVLFEDIDEKDLERIGQLIKERSLKKDEVLFKDGDMTKGIYMIKSGKVEISKVTTDGWKQTLTILAAGNFFGELSILEKRKHEATVTALENAVVYLLSIDEFERMEREEPMLASKIIKRIALVMSKNLRRMNEKFLNALISY